VLQSSQLKASLSVLDKIRYFIHLMLYLCGFTLKTTTLFLAFSVCNTNYELQH
jgi:hypothetical protein